MFDFGTWGEILVILVIALVVISPKDIPKVAQTVGRWMYKFRKFTNEIRSHVDDLTFQAQREDIMKQSKTESKNDDD